MSLSIGDPHSCIGYALQALSLTIFSMQPACLIFDVYTAGLMLRLERLRRSANPTRPTPLAAWTPEFWHSLTAGDALDQFLRSCHAPSTQATYASQQRQFQEFCRMLGAPSAAACFTHDVLAAWVMGRSTHGYKLSTIELGIHAVSHLAQQHGVHLSCTAQPLKSALQAAARKRGSSPIRKLPILLSTLRQLAASDSSSWIAARDSAFYILSWHGMLRGSETAALQWQHISVEQQGIVLFIASSKTDQAGEGQFVFLHSHPDSSICPLRAVHRLSCMTPMGSLTGPVFKTYQHSSQQLRKATMLTRLHRRLQSIGLPSHLQHMFGLHSLRSGGATAAAQQQVPERLIKIHGRWTSDTVRVYTCALPEDRWATSIAMGQAQH